MKYITKLTLILLCLSVSPVIIFSILTFDDVNNTLESLEDLQLSNNLHHQQMVLEDNLSIGNEFGHFFQHLPETKKISLLANNPTSFENVFDSDTEYVKITNFWKSFLENTQTIESISYLDLKGNEILHVYRDNGEIEGGLLPIHENHISEEFDNFYKLEEDQIYTIISDSPLLSKTQYLVYHISPIFQNDMKQGYFVWITCIDVDIFKDEDESNIEYYIIDQDLSLIASTSDKYQDEIFNLNFNDLNLSGSNSIHLDEPHGISYNVLHYNLIDQEKYIVIFAVSENTPTSFLSPLLLVTVGIIISITILVVMYVGRQITRPIETLSIISKKLLVGDLTPTKSEKRTDEFGELIDNFNELVKKLNEFSSEVTRVAREVGREGKLGGQAKVEGVEGKWRELTDTVNELEDNLTTQVREIANVTTAVAKGDLSQKVTADVKGEVLELKDTINTMVDQLNEFSLEVTRVAREVGREGKLGGQAKVEGAEGKWKELTDTVNEFSKNISKPIQEIIKMTTAVAEGDLDQEFVGDVQGELIKLKKSLNTMTKKLKETETSKTNFIAMITHELKTPLVPIRGYSEMLAKQKLGSLSDDQKVAVGVIVESIDAMTNLINNLLTLQKQTSDSIDTKLDIQSMNILLNTVYRKMIPAMQSKNIHFEIISSVKSLVNIDSNKITEVFVNLIQNSIDFVPLDNGIISIGCSQQNDVIQCFVKDNGIGIPKEKQNDIFSKFYQVDSSATRKHGGSGLGLAICKIIVEKHGGKIWVDSDGDSGTTFFFTLPRYSKY